MTTKLTLAIDDEVINAAKQYAMKKNTSLSSLVENFLAKVARAEGREATEEFSPLVRKLSGILAPEGDPKQAYRDYLSKKYK